MVISSVENEAQAGRPEMIALEKLQEMFTEMRAQTPWNVDGPLLWGYFFTSSQEEALRRAANHLTGLGYSFVGLHPTENPKVWVLHVERPETHTPQSLFQRNQEFYELASSYGLDSYDGMDVGPLPS
jgi:hypothetical protein